MLGPRDRPVTPGRQPAEGERGPRPSQLTGPPNYPDAVNVCGGLAEKNIPSTAFPGSPSGKGPGKQRVKPSWSDAFVYIYPEPQGQVVFELPRPADQGTLFLEHLARRVCQGTHFGKTGTCVLFILLLNKLEVVYVSKEKAAGHLGGLSVKSLTRFQLRS